jgi:hypothetical protein
MSGSIWRACAERETVCPTIPSISRRGILRILRAMRPRESHRIWSETLRGCERTNPNP